jgi:hypothetical protein
MAKELKEIGTAGRDAESPRLFAPSAARNKDPIRDAFLDSMPKSGRILEIGSGTGEHVAHLAAALPELRFLPGDPDAASRASIAAWTESLANVAPPHAIDVTRDAWRQEVAEPIDAAFSINMTHIAPFAAARGLFAGAGVLLQNGGKLFLYGPFARNGAHTAPSNAEFDANLKSRNPAWGVRDLDLEIIPLAGESGFVLERIVEMPANNFSVIFRKIR